VKESCATCRFSFADDKKSRQCRRNPPVALARLNEPGFYDYVFPMVWSDDWCGEYKSNSIAFPCDQKHDKPCCADPDCWQRGR
jgi:hypothetical protein